MPVFNRTRFLVGVLFMTSFCGSSNTLAASAPQPEKFTNTHIEYKTTWRDMWKVTKAYFRDNRDAATPTFDIPVSALTPQMLDAVAEDSVIKLGHSTTLLKLAERYILIDRSLVSVLLPSNGWDPSVSTKRQFHWKICLN